MVTQGLEHRADIRSFFGTRFEVLSLIGFGELLALFKRYYLVAVQIGFGPHEHKYIIVSLAVKINFAHPGLEVFKAFCVV